MEEILKKLKDSEQIKEQIKNREQKRQVEFITLNSLLTRVENLEIKFKQLSFESSQDKPSLEDLENKIDGIEKSTNMYIRCLIRCVYTLLRITLYENLNESDRILVSNRIDELSRMANDDV